MAVDIRPWDPVERLETDEAQRAYLEAALEDGDHDLIVAVVGDIARARGMNEIASLARVKREVMYKSFRKGGNPARDTLFRVAEALGCKLALPRESAA